MDFIAGFAFGILTTLAVVGFLIYRVAKFVLNYLGEE
jgi:hypothetical protein